MMGTEDPEGGTEQVLGPADPEKNRLSPDRVLGRLLAPPESTESNQWVKKIRQMKLQKIQKELMA